MDFVSGQSTIHTPLTEAFFSEQAHSCAQASSLFARSLSLLLLSILKSEFVTIKVSCKFVCNKPYFSDQTRNLITTSPT